LTVVMPRFLAVGLGVVGVAVTGAAAFYWWFDAPQPAIPGVLLSVGPAAKADPYAVAQGAVTHGEAVLISFGDGDFAFFVNRADDILALVNGCGERAAPVLHKRLPFLVEASFRLRNVPPYLIEGRSSQYLFDVFAVPDHSACG
jgi:hypothetical protein